MTEERAEGKGGCCSHKCCGGPKLLIGGLIGLLLAGAGFGLYQAGKCAGAGGRACPFSGQSAPVK